MNSECAVLATSGIADVSERQLIIIRAHEPKGSEDAPVKARGCDASAEPFPELRAGHGRQGEAVAKIDDVVAESALPFENTREVPGELIATMEFEAGHAKWIVNGLQQQEELGPRIYLW
jgi:hypothetical protein